MARWFEAFFDGLYGRVLAEQFDETRTLQQALLVKRLLRLRKGQHVLDIPCGLGRLTIPLAHRGLVMTGVDLTRGFIQKARRAAGRKRLDIRFVCSDMRDIAFDREFDAAFNWFTSIGYFSDEEEVRFCRAVLHALKPGRRFLIETINRSWAEAHFQRRPREDVIGGVRVKQTYRGHTGDGRVDMLWTLSRGRTRERNLLSVRHYNGAEIRALMAGAGFRDIRLFGHPPVGRLTRHSRRLIAIGTRPKEEQST